MEDGSSKSEGAMSEGTLVAAGSAPLRSENPKKSRKVKCRNVEVNKSGMATTRSATTEAPNDLPSRPENIFVEQGSKRGVIYVAKVPPFMQYTKFHQYFSEFGTVGKIFMKPENNEIYKRRVARGGTTKQNFVEAWVEFEDKQAAKQVATALNGRQVGGKKMHNFWREDVWTLKYLPGFEWRHLNEKQNYLKSIRADKLNSNYSQLKRLMGFYADRVVEKKSRENRKRKRSAKESTEVLLGEQGDPEQSPERKNEGLGNDTGQTSFDDNGRRVTQKKIQMSEQNSKTNLFSSCSLVDEADNGSRFDAESYAQPQKEEIATRKLKRGHKDNSEVTQTSKSRPTEVASYPPPLVPNKQSDYRQISDKLLQQLAL